MKECLVSGVSLPESLPPRAGGAVCRGRGSGLPGLSDKPARGEHDDVRGRAAGGTDDQPPVHRRPARAGAVPAGILDGILDFEVERGNWAYTYHSRMAGQFDFIVQELRRNPDSRRAVIRRARLARRLREGLACLPAAHPVFHPRRPAAQQGPVPLQRRLQSLVYERFRAHPVAGPFCRPARPAHRQLHAPGQQLPCVREGLPVLEGYVNRIRSGSPVTYDYTGGWAELMDAEKAGIRASVEELKSR